MEITKFDQFSNGADVVMKEGSDTFFIFIDTEDGEIRVYKNDISGNYESINVKEIN